MADFFSDIKQALNKPAICFIVLFAALSVRLMYQASYYPVYSGGEEAAVLDKITEFDQGIAQGQPWFHTLVLFATDYSKGYSWIIYPFYKYFGYDLRLVITAVSLLTGLCCVSYFMIHRGTCPSRSSLASFLLIMACTLFVLCLRRYKWHSMSYPAVLAIYLYFLPRISGCRPVFPEKWVKAVAASLFGAAFFFYFGNIIFAAPFLFFLFLFEFKGKWHFRMLAAVAGLLIISMLWIFSTSIDQVWMDRMKDTVLRLSELRQSDIFSLRMETVRIFFMGYFSPGFLALFVLGFLVSLRRAWLCDGFAILNVTLFCWALAVQFVMHGISNPDTLNWCMLPLLGFLLAGFDCLYGFFRQKGGPLRLLFLFLAGLVAWNELHFYPTLHQRVPHQQGSHPMDTTAQSALVLRLIREDVSGRTQYYLPAASVPVGQGGFFYQSNLMREDFRDAVSRVVFFNDRQDLQSKVETLPKGRQGIVFLSVSGEEGQPDGAARDMVPEGLREEIIHPYEKIYQIRFPVRKYLLN